MEAQINLELGIQLTLATMIFGAGGFYAMGLFNGKKLDKVLDDVSNIKNDIGQIKLEMKTDINKIKSDLEADMTKIKINMGVMEQKLHFVGRT